jgi:hypothetical protein
MQCLWRKVGAIGPSNSAAFLVELNFGKIGWISKGLEHRTGEKRLYVYSFAKAVIEN